MRNIEKAKISWNSKIKDAIESINKGSMRMAFVCDGEVLVGIIGDPDIRQAMLRGLTLDDPIDSIINKKPITANINDSREQLLKLSSMHKVYEIPILDNNGYIVGLEEIDELLKQKQRINKVVIMAGGLGTRLGEYTKETPKPMLKVANKPILETIIENFSKYGFFDIFISVNYLSHIIKDYFGNGSRFGVKIKYIHETKRLGTAGALSLVRDELNEPFIVINGDILTNINFEQLVDFHIIENSEATMCVREHELQVPYGVVHIQKKRIITIDEKPTQNFYVNAGIYVFSPEALNEIPDDQFFDMPTLFDILIKKNKRAIPFPIKGYWLDIGHLNDYEKAKMDYREVFE